MDAKGGLQGHEGAKSIELLMPNETLTLSNEQLHVLRCYRCLETMIRFVNWVAQMVKKLPVMQDVKPGILEVKSTHSGTWQASPNPGTGTFELSEPSIFNCLGLNFPNC